MSACISGGCSPASRTQPGLPPKRALNASTTSRTVQVSAARGPRFRARGASCGDSTRACARARYPDRGSSTCCHGRTASTVRNEPLGRPIAAADDIAGARRRKRRPVCIEAVAKTRRHEFSARFAAAVGIGSAQAVGLEKGAAIAVELIDLVARDHEHALQARREPAGLQQIDRTQHVRRIGAQGIAVRIAHQGLGRHVNDDLRSDLRNHIAHQRSIGNVSDYGVHSPADQRPQVRCGRGREGKSGRVGAERAQPHAHPGTFKAGVPGQQNLASLPEGIHRRCHWRSVFSQ